MSGDCHVRQQIIINRDHHLQKCVISITLKFFLDETNDKYIEYICGRTQSNRNES